MTITARVLRLPPLLAAPGPASGGLPATTAVTGNRAGGLSLRTPPSRSTSERGRGTRPDPGPGRRVDPAAYSTATSNVGAGAARPPASSSDKRSKFLGLCVPVGDERSNFSNEY